MSRRLLKIYIGGSMETDLDRYHGLDNRDLKLRNLAAWEFPKPLTNYRVIEIVRMIPDMEAGEMKLGYKGTRYEAKLLQSALWRLIKQHAMGVQVVLKGVEIYLRKDEI